MPVNLCVGHVHEEEPRTIRKALFQSRTLLADGVSSFWRDFNIVKKEIQHRMVIINNLPYHIQKARNKSAFTAYGTRIFGRTLPIRPASWASLCCRQRWCQSPISNCIWAGLGARKCRVCRAKRESKKQELLNRHKSCSLRPTNTKQKRIIP